MALDRSGLPDVDESGYDEWQNQLFQEDADRRIASLTFQHEANDRISDLSRIGVWAAASPPEAQPAPEPLPPEPVSPELALEPAAPAAGAPVGAPPSSPVSTLTTPPAPSAGGVEPSPAFDPFATALNAMSHAGGDLTRFSSELTGALSQGGQDFVAASLTAAERAGADLDQFVQNFSVPPPPPPPVSTLAIPSGPGGGGASVAGGPLQDYARQAALRAGVDPDIFVRQIQQESGFNPAARSPAGAQGIAQIVPKFHPGVDVTDPYASLDYAANLMRSSVARYGGDYAKALASYNAGPGAVERYGGVPPFEETQRYVSTILSGKAPGPTPVQGLERAGAAIEGANRVDPTGHTFPLIGYKVGSNGNNDPHATYHLAGGSDLMAPRGTPVVAVGGGTVMQIMTEDPNRPGSTIGGNAIQIRGDDGLDYYYAHLDGAPQLKQGQKIAAGDMLGAVGNTGNAWKGGKGETHLHIGIGRGISTGTGAEGGLGQQFDAKGFLSGLLPTSADARPDFPRVSPHEPDQENNPTAWLDNVRQTLAESLAPPKPQPSTELPGAAVLPERSSVISPISDVLGIGGGEPNQQAASIGQPHAIEVAGQQAPPPPAEVPKNPLEEMGSNIANAITSGLRSLGIAGEAAQPVNVPGGGYDPSAMGRPRTAEVTSLPVLSGLGELIDQGRQELPAPTSGPSGEPVPDIGAGLGAAGRELERQRAEERDLTSASAYIPGGAADPGGVLSAYLRGTGVYPEDEGIQAPLVGRIGRPELAGALANVAIPSGAEEAFGTGASRTFTAAERAARRAAAPPGLVDVAGDVARRGAGEVYTRGVEAAERAFPPETAYAETFEGRAARAAAEPPASPELTRLNEMFEPTTPAAGGPGALERADTIRRNITRALFDRQVDISQAQQRYADVLGRPLRAEEMAAELQRLASDPAAQVYIDEGLRPAIRAVGDDYRALRNYVTLRSNVQVADALGNDARLFSGGLTKADSQAALQALEAELGPDRFARVQTAADEVSDFSNQLRARLVDSGVLSQQQAEEMAAKYPDWVKTRILDYMGSPSGGQSAGSKIGLANRDVHEYTQAGTARAREDPLASMVAYAHQVERMARKNEAFNAFVDLDQASPTPSLREVPQDFSPTRDQVTIVGFRDGQKVKYVTDNKALGEAINGAGVMTTPEWTSAWQKVFRSLATSRNPLFLAGNVALDVPAYTFRSAIREGGPQSLPRVMSELARGYGDAFQGLLQGEYRGAQTARFLKGGGGQAGFFTGGEGQAAQTVQALRRGNVFEINNAADLGRLAKDLITLKPVEAVGERLELGPRVAAMRLAERRGANPVEAVINGRTVTVDFSQGGTVTKYLNNFIPFFNVGFQGPAQVARAFRENPRAAVATVGSLIGLPTVAAEAWNRSDAQRAKDYADVPQYVKDQGIVVMLPGEAAVDAQGNRKPLYAVVKLREWAPFASLARDAAARVVGDDTRSWQDVALSAAKGFSPTQATSAAQAATEPLSAIPILPALAQLEANRDFFRNRAIVTQRADENASALAKSLTPILQQAADRAGMSVEVRPSAIDFIIRNQGAGVGGAVLGASDVLAGKPPREGAVTSVPVVGGLAGRFVGTQTGQQLQAAQDETLTPSARQILRDNGVTTTPGAVSGSINQIPLRLEEQARYQQLTNRYVDDAIHRAAEASDWNRLTPQGKESRMRQVISDARDRAGLEVLNAIPADEKRRRLAAKSAV